MKKIEEREHLIAVRLELGQTASQTSVRKMREARANIRSHTPSERRGVLRMGAAQWAGERGLCA